MNTTYKEKSNYTLFIYLHERFMQSVRIMGCDMEMYENDLNSHTNDRDLKT